MFSYGILWSYPYWDVPSWIACFRQNIHQLLVVVVPGDRELEREKHHYLQHCMFVILVVWFPRYWGLIEDAYGYPALFIILPTASGWPLDFRRSWTNCTLESNIMYIRSWAKNDSEILILKSSQMLCVMYPAATPQGSGLRYLCSDL